MRKLREIVGYALGGLMFVLLLPTLMWLASGMPSLGPASFLRMVTAVVLALVGLVKPPPESGFSLCF